MSVDLEKLPLEEILLLDAVERMCGQYPGSRMNDIGTAILTIYGFDIDGLGYLESRRFLELDSIAQRYKDQIGEPFNTSSWQSDRSLLNRRSHYLLIVLAGLSQEFLHNSKRQDVDELDHICMSAGEHACTQLAAYSLLRISNRGGCWTALGKEAVELGLNPVFDPIADFNFEGAL